METKIEWYKKLANKLNRIKSGDLYLDEYIKEVNLKIKNENQSLQMISPTEQKEQFVCRDCEKPTKEYRDQLCELCHKWYTNNAL